MGTHLKQRYKGLGFVTLGKATPVFIRRGGALENCEIGTAAAKEELDRTWKSKKKCQRDTFWNCFKNDEKHLVGHSV